MEHDKPPPATGEDQDAEAERIANAWRLLVERRDRREGSAPAATPTAPSLPSPPGPEAPTAEVRGEAVQRWEDEVAEVAQLASELTAAGTPTPSPVADDHATRLAAWRLARTTAPVPPAVSSPPLPAPAKAPRSRRAVAAAGLVLAGTFLAGVGVGMKLQEVGTPVTSVDTSLPPAPTPEASATPTPTAPGAAATAGSAPSPGVVPTVVVVTAASGLHLRAAPSPTAPILGSLGRGDRLQVLAYSEANGGWYRVATPVGSGWVSADPTLTTPSPTSTP